MSADDRLRRRRILRYGLRPRLAAAQVRATRDDRVAFELRHPRNNGATHAVFSELGFLRKLATIVPPPGRHETTHFGILSSASRLGNHVVPAPPLRLEIATPPAPDDPIAPVVVLTYPRRQSWAALLRRVYGVDPMSCPRCGGGLRFVAAITQATVIRKILEHLDLDDEPPPPAPRSRAPPELFADSDA